MADLDDINGVGPSRAEKLDEAGYATPSDVAEAEEEDLQDVLGGAADVLAIKDSAGELALDDESEPDDPRSVTRTLDVDDYETALYLGGGLIEELLRLRGRNQIDDAEEIKDLIERLFQEACDDGIEMDVDLDDLSSMYNSVRNMEQRFQQTAGISGDMVGRARALRVEIQSLRDELWPDT